MKSRQKTSKKILILFLSVLAVFGTGLSCSGSNASQDQVTLRFWKPYDSSDRWADIIAAYGKQNKNVKIEYTKKSTEDYERDLIEAMAAGQGPDIFSIKNDSLPRFRDKITPAPEQQLPVRQYKETFVTAATADLVENNRVYAIPASVDVLALFYNRQHLASASIARPPSTWPELVSLVPRLTKLQSNGQVNQSAIAMGTSANVSGSADILSLLMLQSGVQMFDQSGNTPTISRGTTDENRETPAARSLRFYTQFSDPSSRAYTWNARLDNSIDAFAQGRASMILGNSFLIPVINAKDSFLDYGITTAPQLSADQNKINYASFWAETVWNGSPNSKAAWDFILFANSYEQNKAYVTKAQLPSSRRDVLIEQQKDPVLGVFADSVLSARTISKPEAVQFDRILTDMIDDVSLAGIAPQDSVKRAEDKIKLLLGRYPLQSRAGSSF